MKNDGIYLEHILEAIKSIKAYTKDAKIDDFVKNEMMREAVIRKLEIIGEAARNISAGTKAKIKEIEWPAVAGMRNRLIHEYFDVNFDLVWETVKKDLPKLRKAIRQYLKAK
ncbi:DUF86 domain-containing protein [Patescibacteria group bacterium]|nr:DUF86 domain-containing protein [Patescibacteria group bacterium]MBU1703205.1 DUF86 domain-containing protein [Patescibacteria group bacterium]MBU1954368.1 DUF86 domain-containing protein [Patescibacteria group bacterium]